MKECLEEITKWMGVNFLKLNGDKTQIKIFKHKFSIIPDITSLGQICTESVKVLGVKLDENLSFNDFVGAKIRTCNFHLRNLYNVKDSLNIPTRIMMITNLIWSTIDYCNILLLGMNDRELKPLKLMMNRAVRFIYNVKPRSHITPYYKKAHFLPIKQRIQFKACVTAFKIFNNLSPEYLSDGFIKFVPTSSIVLREGSGRDKYMFQINANQNSQKTLFMLIKIEWNKLPLQIRKLSTVGLFKARLKTHLFSEY